MTVKKCIECNKRPIYIKKRELCVLCYGRLKKKGVDFTPNGTALKTLQKYSNIREIEFVKNYFIHKNWVHHPAVFRLDEKTKYTPDFYDGEKDIFIEVAGTRQAFHKNKDKYDLLKKVFPLINFEVRTPIGELLQKDKKGRFIWNQQPMA